MWCVLEHPVAIEVAHTGVTDGNAATDAEAVKPALGDRGQDRRLAGGDGAVEHRGLAAVDDGQDELLGHARR